ncbi:MAG TPA: hypothetical protein VIK60_16590 [Vicinamibacterales bacterium]
MPSPPRPVAAEKGQSAAIVLLIIIVVFEIGCASIESSPVDVRAEVDGRCPAEIVMRVTAERCPDVEVAVAAWPAAVEVHPVTVT